MEYMDSYDKTENLFEKEVVLLDEAKGLKGMMAEVTAKARLLQNDLEKEKIQKEASGEELVPSDAIHKRMDSLRVDFHRYSQRFDEVLRELRDIYDEIENTAGLDIG